MGDSYRRCRYIMTNLIKQLLSLSFLTTGCFLLNSNSVSRSSKLNTSFTKGESNDTYNLVKNITKFNPEEEDSEADEQADEPDEETLNGSNSTTIALSIFFGCALSFFFISWALDVYFVQNDGKDRTFRVFEHFPPYRLHAIVAFFVGSLNASLNYAFGLWYVWSILITIGAFI